MNKLSYFIAALFLSISVGVSAQDASTTGTAESNYAILKNKIEKSDEQKTDEKKNTTSKFWLKRAEIMHDIFNLHRQFLQPGVPEVTVIIFYPNPKERKEWTEGSSTYKELIYDMITITLKDGTVEKWEDTKPLYENPLPDGLESLEKTEELDVENKLAKKIIEGYQNLKMDFDRLAREEYFAENYKGAYEAFAVVDQIAEKEIMKDEPVDTLRPVILFYTGLAASKAGLPNECIKYYEKSIDAGYEDSDIYVYLSFKYREIGDTVKGIQVLQNAHEKYPENQSILIELINYYLLSGQSEEALHFLNLAKEKDPGNKSFIFAEATLYEGMKDLAKARELYEKCISIDSEYFDAYYNIGVTYFNEAVELYKKSDNATGLSMEENDKIMAEAGKVLEKAKPYMEKAHELKPKEVIPIETLRTIYRRLKMFDKSDEMQALLDEIESENVGSQELKP